MKKGYTLIEILISLAIFTVISGGIFIAMLTGRNTWYSSDAQIELQDELRRAMTQIVNDLKQSSATKLYVDSSLAQPFPSNDVPYGSIAFFLDQGVNFSGAIIWSNSPVSYTLSGDQILRTVGIETSVAANKITGMNFTRPGSLPNVIRISLSAQKTTQLGQTLNGSLVSSVSVRN